MSNAGPDRDRVRALWLAGLPVPSIAKQMNWHARVIAAAVSQLTHEERLAGLSQYLSDLREAPYQ